MTNRTILRVKLPEGDKGYLTSRDYQNAIFAQQACNVSGLVIELSRVMTRIWNEANRDGHGTEWVNNHPIVRLYSEQIRHLCSTDYMKAYDECEKHSKGEGR